MQANELHLIAFDVQGNPCEGNSLMELFWKGDWNGKQH